MDSGQPDSARLSQQQQPQTLSELNSGTSHEPRDLSSGRADSDPVQRSPDAIETAGGTWRRDEHDRFMQALETYGSTHTGDEWRHITAFVGTRSIDEVRLHGRQYLQQLVQQLPPPTSVSALGRGCQNDPNHQNYQLSSAKDDQKTHVPSTKKLSTAQTSPVPFSSSSSSALNAAALEAAQAMLIKTPVALQKTGSAPRRHGRRPKVWTFQEDKTFETALADWTGSKPYSWTKIASSLPGKTAKDVRNRYEKLVGDISSIETGALRVPEAPTPASSSNTRSTVAPSTLSRRTVPPPPIQVPASSGKDSAFPSSGSTRSSGGGSASAGLGFGMLSPTFLDLLAGDGDDDGEDKPALPLTGLGDLPSPLLPPPSLFPAASPFALHPRPKTPQFAVGDAQDKRLAASLDVVMQDAATTGDTLPRRTTTPRIWRDFLAEDFKLNETRQSPHASRVKSGNQMPRAAANAAKADAGQQDVEMQEAPSQ